MNLLRQVYQAPIVRSEQKHWLGSQFVFDNDDVSLQVSGYLDSSESQAEILGDVTQVLRAYGFTNFAPISQAPGSYYFSINVKFGKNDRQAAQRSKRELQQDLLKDALPQRPPQKRRAVQKLKKSIWRRAGMGLVTIILAGTSFLGNVTADVFHDEIKGGIEKVLKDHGPEIVRKADSVAAKELPADVANSIHKAVKDYIDNSPSKTEQPPPSK
jgi:hypothetical protein